MPDSTSPRLKRTSGAGAPARHARAAVVLAAMLAAALAGPAGAAPAASAPTVAVKGVSLTPVDPAPAGEKHCVSPAVPAGSTRTKVTTTCFATFAQSIAFATDGAVQLPAGATTVSQAQLDAGHARRRDLASTQGVAAASSTVVLGISYWRTDYRGDTWTHTGTSGCDTDPDVDWQNGAGLGGWDDEISSAQAYSDCTGKYWAGSSFNGANIDTWWSDGVMDNAASSIQWR